MRLRAFRDGRAAFRLAATRALLENGLLDALDASDGPRDALQVTQQADLTDVDLTRALLELGEAYGLVRRRATTWELTRKGRSLVRDATGRAMVEALGGTTSTSTASSRTSCAAARGGTTSRRMPS